MTRTKTSQIVTTQMIGTPRQVSWATTIRTQLLAQCEQWLADAREERGAGGALIASLEGALDRLRAIEHADAWIAVRSLGAYHLLRLVAETTAGKLDGLDDDDPKFVLAARLPEDK